MQNAKFLFILLIFRFAFAPSFVRKLACRDSASRGNLSLPTSLHKIDLPILIVVSNLFFICHCEERSDVAISFPKLIRQRRLFHLFSRKKVNKKRRGDKF